MRVLFTTWADRSIFQAMVPLAWALRTSGHDVRVAGPPALTDLITGAGLTAVPVGRDSGFWRLTGMNVRAREALRPGLPAPYDAAVAEPADVDEHAMRDGYRRVVGQWHKLDNFPMTAALIELAQVWRPDLVVWETTTFAGAIAARACRAASVRLIWSVDVFGRAREAFGRVNHGHDPMAQWLEPYARALGGEFGEDLVTGHATIDPLPASLRLAADLVYLPMRYIAYGGAAVVPPWLREPPDRPRVALTLGTTAADNFSGFATDVGEVLDALAELEVEVVATIADGERAKLGRVPPNTRVVAYVPLQALAPTCAVVVNHAGPGTLLTIATHAVPQVLLPYDFDEPALAGQVARQGSAVTLPAADTTGAAVRAGVVRLLHDPSFAAAADRLRSEMVAMPSPNDVVIQLETLAGSHR